MQTCLEKLSQSTKDYFNEVKEVSRTQMMMKGTILYPSFILSIAANILCILCMSGYLIYYSFTVDNNTCYEHISVGIKILSILYPIEALLLSVCIVGSAVLSKSYIWKFLTIVSFGFIVAGFPFGGIGFAFLCTIQEVNPLLIKTTFLASNTFIQIIVYFYVGFFFMYGLVIPLITFAFKKRQQKPNQQPTSCDRFCCVTYYIFQTLFIILSLFILLIKLLGIPLLIYTMVQLTRSHMNSSGGNLVVFYVFAILTFCLPVTIFISVTLFTKFRGNTNDLQIASERGRETGKIQLSNQTKDKIQVETVNSNRDSTLQQALI